MVSFLNLLYLEGHTGKGLLQIIESISDTCQTSSMYASIMPIMLSVPLAFLHDIRHHKDKLVTTDGTL